MLRETGLNSPEAYTSPLEVRHVGNFDVVINRTLFDQEWVSEAFESLDTPEKISSIVSSARKQAGEFFIKRKANSGAFSVRFSRRSNLWTDYQKQAINTGNSISNELSLAGKVGRIIESDEAQDLAKKYGFTSIDFAEPLIAIVDRSTTEKYIIYEHIEHANSAGDDVQVAKLVPLLNDLFIKKGIEPNDLHLWQILRSETETGKKLTLIDTELYKEI